MIGDIARILLVANATSLGWGLRGEWGHWWGATVPGALCGMSLWLAYGLSSGGWQMMAYGALLAVALSVGGIMSYGLLVGYATAEKGRGERSPTYGCLALFLTGGLWGFFAGVGLGLLTTGTEYKVADLAMWAVLASAGALMGYAILVRGLDLHLTPPRSDAWAAFLGAVVSTTIFFALWSHDMVVVANSALGWIGFGSGFSLGAVIHREGDRRGLGFSTWKFMEHNVGFFGGLALAVPAALHNGGPQSLDIGSSWKWAILLFQWFMFYMVVTNNLDHWTTDTKWLSRRIYVALQIGLILSLIPFIYLARPFVREWSGGGSSLVFVSLLFLLTIIGTAKFIHGWGDLRSRVVATFWIQFALVCFLLLLV